MHIRLKKRSKTTEGAIDVLTEAKTMLSDSSRWLRKAGFYTGDGAVDDRNAAYSPVGACLVAGRRLRTGTPRKRLDSFAVNRALSSLKRAIPDPDDADGAPCRIGDWRVESYNCAPTTTHGDVLAWFDRAIRTLRDSS